MHMYTNKFVNGKNIILHKALTVAGVSILCARLMIIMLLFPDGVRHIPVL